MIMWEGKLTTFTLIHYREVYLPTYNATWSKMGTAIFDHFERNIERRMISHYQTTIYEALKDAIQNGCTNDRRQRR